MRPSHCEDRALPPTGPWLNNRAECVTRFRKWIADMAKRFPPGSSRAHLFGARSHGNERDKWYNASQISWLVDSRGAVLVNAIIKLEELEAKWPTLQKHICGFARSPYAEDASLKRNPSSHGHYSEYYDDATRTTVEAYMAADLAAFGYRFESAPLPEEKHATPSG